MFYSSSSSSSKIYMQTQNMNLVLSTDAKPRLKWTPELHQKFVEAVNQLGGADKATPKSLMRVMGIHGLTLYHLKSHLQKYRLGKSQTSETSINTNQEEFRDVQNTDTHLRGNVDDGTQSPVNESLQIAQALQLQMEVQRKLHEQIEVGLRNYDWHFNSGYSSSTIGLELAKAELSQLATMASSSISELTESGGLMSKNLVRKQMRGTICSVESSLTSSESSGRNEEEQPKNDSSETLQFDMASIELNKPKNSISRGEIILSAGALGSPQILLLSGIGPGKHLKNFNIPVKVDLEGVGQGMIDNPSIALLVDTKPQKLYPDTPQVVGITKGFKFIVEAGVIPISFNATRVPIAIKLAFPASKGKLELNSTDPRQNPLVEFNYLSNKQDLEQCVEMAQLVGRVARSEPVAFFLGNEPKNNLMSTSEEELKRFCKKNLSTYYHYHGGCAVGSVVDKDYKVYCVKGLRVIDGSILKESPGTNPMATLMMLGRYQGIKILSERKDA